MVKPMASRFDGMSGEGGGSALSSQGNFDSPGIGRPLEDVVGLHHLAKLEMMGGKLGGIDLAGRHQAEQRRCRVRVHQPGRDGDVP